MELVALERRARVAVQANQNLAKTLMDEDQVAGVRDLCASAATDLVAGCEIARAGYSKQAYSLWRAWFEQSLFALYFIEAPLHRQAWKVFEEVGPKDSPQYRLMLHQLLAESGEQHPFALVYAERHKSVLDALKISGLPKDERPVSRASRVLTVLSQGVHGTYQPRRPDSMESNCQLIKTHCLPILTNAVETVLVFWILLLLSVISAPDEILISMRDGIVTREELGKYGLGDEVVAAIMEIAPAFQSYFRLGSTNGR